MLKQVLSFALMRMIEQGIRAMMLNYQRGRDYHRIPDEKFGNRQQAHDWYKNVNNKPRTQNTVQDEVDLRNAGSYYIRPWLWCVLIVCVCWYWVSSSNAAFEREEAQRIKLFTAQVQLDTAAWERRFLRCVIERKAEHLIGLPPWELNRIEYMRRHCMHIDNSIKQ